MFDHSDRRDKHQNMKKTMLSNKSTFLHHFSALLIKLGKNDVISGFYLYVGSAYVMRKMPKTDGNALFPTNDPRYE